MKKLILLALIYLPLLVHAQLRPIDCITNWDSIVNRVNDNDSYLDTKINHSRVISTNRGLVLSDTGQGGDYYTPRQVDSAISASGGGGLTDAPSDGSTYGRNNAAWTVISSGGTSSDTTGILSFIIGSTLNAPSAGDSTITNIGFNNKHIEVFRNGLNTISDNYTLQGVELTVRPPFKTADTMKIYTYDNPYKSLVLADTGSGGGGGTYSDDFNGYSSGTALAGQGNWLAGVGTLTCNGTGIYPNSSGTIVILYNAIITNNQFSELSLAGNSSRRLGILLRGNSSNGGNGYLYIHTGSNSVFGKLNDGVYTQLGINSSAGDPVTLRLEVEGTTIRCYLNGVLDTGLTGGTGVFTDSDFSSGFIGLYGNNASSILVGDDWSGGDL